MRIKEIYKEAMQKKGFTPTEKGVTSEIVKAEWLTSPKVVKMEPVAVPIEHKDEVPVKEPPESVLLKGKEAKKTSSGTQTESHMHSEEEMDWKSGVSKHMRNTCNQIINTITE